MKLLITLAVVAWPVSAGLALAQTVTLDLNDEPRSQALAQLIPEGSAEITWRDPALADEPVHGHFEGTPTQVLREILAPADFAAVYSDDGGELRLTRLIVLDRQQPPPGPVATTPLEEPPSQMQIGKMQQQQQLLVQQRVRQQQANPQPMRMTTPRPAAHVMPSPGTGG